MSDGIPWIYVDLEVSKLLASYVVILSCQKREWIKLEHFYEQTSTKPARYYGTYRNGEQPWMSQRSTKPAKST